MKSRLLMSRLSRLVPILLTVSMALHFTFFTLAIADTEEDSVWNGGLRKLNFGDREILETQDVIRLTAPERADDGAIVPVKIEAQIPQTEERYIKTVTLLIDKNPIPTAGIFHFTPRSGRANLALRIRMNEYSPVRAIAETNDGKLYMTKEFVKASGGCSAPVGSDLEAAMSRLGKMRFRTEDDTSLSSPVEAQLAISHPNVTGLQMDQLTRMYAPAHYIKQVSVSFEGEKIFSAETDISVSENPNFRFYLVPGQKGELTAEVIDSQGKTFTQTYMIGEDTPTVADKSANDNS